MFCKNCGNEMNPNAEICVKCGVRKGVGTSFCPNCGEATEPNAAVCLKCGYSLATIVPQNTPVTVSGEQKSKMVAALLAFFLGAFGAQNFYLGYTGKAVAQIALNLCCGVGYIWSIVEGIMILTGSINQDAKGIPLKE